MKRTGLGGILVLLCLGSVSLEARGDDLQRFLAQIQREAASKPVARRPAKPSFGEKARCVAFCAGGTTVSVDYCSSCIAQDQDCSRDQQGYAQCIGSSPVYCPPCIYTAQCQHTTVSVSCPGSGTQVDHACPDERGYVQCSGGDPVVCPPCDDGTCYASAPCPDGGSVDCEGHNNSCQSYPGGCRVQCDGRDYSCDTCH